MLPVRRQFGVKRTKVAFAKAVKVFAGSEVPHRNLRRATAENQSLTIRSYREIVPTAGKANFERLQQLTGYGRKLVTA